MRHIYLVIKNRYNYKGHIYEAYIIGYNVHVQAPKANLVILS